MFLLILDVDTIQHKEKNLIIGLVDSPTVYEHVIISQQIYSQVLKELLQGLDSQIFTTEQVTS